MKVVLAEKPSVARDIASFLGARARRDGYLEGGGYQVTWAFGHLVSLKEPGEYDPALKKWSLAPLPFVPDPFELKLIGDKKARQQFATIKRLFRHATELICATDAGREGELIFRYILDLTGCAGKPQKRLWLSSLTQKAIRDAFRNLRPTAEFDALYAAARCRSQADWIVGLNATRNFTVRYGSNGLLWSAGRVQTPVLAMVVQRDDEIRTFKTEPFWELMTRYRKTEFKFTGGRFQKEEEARKLLQRVAGHKFVIRKLDAKQEKVLPPQLYDLTQLQRDMNRRYGISAAETLKIAQSLYESKLISYPRTDSRYLSTDMKQEIPGILRDLQTLKPNEIDKLNLSALAFSGRIINNQKVSDHHAIIPTGGRPGHLSSRHQQVFDAVVTRLIAAFYPPCLKNITHVYGESNNVPFLAKGVHVTVPGWTELYPRKGADKEADEFTLPTFRPGEHGPHDPYVKAGETTPPKHFTENTLLAALETAGKFVDEEELREALKEKGLGTPATRAAIIETLLLRKYIQRTKKQLTATDRGRYLIAVVQERNLKSPELTGQWEAKLKRIEAGKVDPNQFMQEITAYAANIIQHSDAAEVDESKFGECPRCGRPIIQGKRGYGCSAWREGCTFVLWSSYKEYELSTRQIRQLLQRQVLIQPVDISSQDRVVLYMTRSGEIMELPEPSADPHRDPHKTVRRSQRGGTGAAPGAHKPAGDKSSRALGACPLCGAEVVEQKKSFSCSGWQQGCKFVIWKTVAHKRISRRTAQTILRHGKSSLLKGFRSKAGKPFDARLKLDGGDVRFDFPS